MTGSEPWASLAPSPQWLLCPSGAMPAPTLFGAACCVSGVSSRKMLLLTSVRVSSGPRSNGPDCGSASRGPGRTPAELAAALAKMTLRLAQPSHLGLTSALCVLRFSLLSTSLLSMGEPGPRPGVRTVASSEGPPGLCAAGATPRPLSVVAPARRMGRGSSLCLGGRLAAAAPGSLAR